ncbi:ADP-ribosylglycohydrolase family protein [Arthrobacter sp. H41]|uniref:ADP-ribosylglycohydrolase family protein n=1 Tax=Arthrobacter sp. H41 TaxID=1312978 RepID=UPI0004791682|nr:ADP-ribosylglycohydrolase family protein [Arthrobacter sp. H41]
MAIEPTYPDQVLGCLLGGALGNALGYARQQATTPESRLAVLQRSPESTAGLPFAEDTQLTLYTVDGLVDALEWANDGVAADETACLWLAYLRWLATQGEVPAPIAPSPPPRPIDRHAVLHARRNPGSTSISGLRTGEMGTRHRPVNQSAQDAGAMSRSAPFGLVPRIPLGMVDKLTRDAAALTHGHSAARTAAVVFATLIHRIVVEFSPLSDAVDRAVEQAGAAGDQDLAAALTRARELAGDPVANPGAVNAPAAPDIAVELGSGYTATGALALAVYAVLAAVPDEGAGTAPGGVPGPVGARDHARAALQLAADIGSNPTTTGSLVGNLIGALYGIEAFPGEWLDRVEGAGVVRETASALIGAIAGEKSRL